MKWPEEYGNLFRSAIACVPRWITRASSSSSVAAASQKRQPVCSSADLMYSRRQGAHSCFTQASLERFLALDRHAFGCGAGAKKGEAAQRYDHPQHDQQRGGEEDGREHGGV